MDQKTEESKLGLQKQTGPFSRILENTYEQPTKIVVKLSSPEMGLGVFATKDIKSGELIERCPMIQTEWRSKYLKDSQIQNYFYSHRCDCQQCNIHGPTMFMVLGYGMLYNHQDDPNTEWKFNWDNLIADVTAVKPIKKGEEIFVFYGSNYWKHRNKIMIEKEK